METAQNCSSYEIVDIPGVVEAIPAGTQRQHTPLSCSCAPLEGLSICGGCGDHVTIYVHQDPRIPAWFIKSALQTIGSQIKKGYHVKD